MPQEHDAAYEIFHTPFLFRIQTLYLYSTEYSKEMGFYSHGNKAMDQRAFNEKRPMFIPISAAAVYHSKSAGIELDNESDSLTIYNLIREHLGNWQRISEEQLNHPDIPVEDLAILDRFAEALYPMATRYMGANITPHLPARSAKRLNESRIGFKRRVTTPVDTKAADQQLLESYSPMIDAIERYSYMNK